MLNNLWYKKHPLRWFLWPLSWLYAVGVHARCWYLTHFKQKKYKTPIIVVGNLTVGGVGKTPLVITLAKQMRARGLKVGIVSRGYGNKLNRAVYEIKITDEAKLVGDEPLLIAQKTHCPVIIARKRGQAVEYLEQYHAIDIIISDDGLQHYAMGRIMEIVVIDGLRGMGNGLYFPAGPLRESINRLKKVDLIVVNEGEWPDAHPMSLKPQAFKQLSTDKSVTADALKGKIAAVAAIGNPQRFYNTLLALGLDITPISFADHYRFQPTDFDVNEKLIIMTEKDAVKCRPFATDAMYYLEIEAVLAESFWHALWSNKQLQGVF